MSPLWTSDEIVAATGGTATADFEVTGIAFDSREIEPGFLFVAMPGTVHDGHDFVSKAVELGAAGLLVSQEQDHPHVLVDDVPAALEALAKAARARLSDDAVVLGVTGSVGKTSTKEALFAALDRSSLGKAHRSVKSYNNHTGVPLSLARMPRETKYGVFEMGMNHAGEIRELTKLVRPHIAMITTIAPAHIEHLGSIEAIADAKAEIFEGLEGPRIAIVPEDVAQRDQLVKAARPLASRTLTFGTGEADAAVVHSVPARGGGSLVTARLPGREVTFTIAQPGQHWVMNALAVLAAVGEAGGDVAVAGLALADMGGLAGRGARHRIKVNGGEALLIDESYNANSASMAATLKSLGDEKGRKVAVLGAMKELGAEGQRLHAELAGPVREAGVEQLILIGDEMAALEAEMLGEIPITRVANVDLATQALQQTIRMGDAVLVKASNSVGLAKLVATMAGAG